MVDMARLQGKVAIVTGAARGIGEAVAGRFIIEGARVWLTDSDAATGAALAATLGPAAQFAALDVRDETAWMTTIAALIAADGRLDILVNNAGITGLESGSGPHDPENTSMADWRAVHATNLDGVFLGCKHAIRAMRPTGTGSIINISSRSGLVGIPGAAAYASSKAAVRDHSKSVALWCAQTGLKMRCNSVHPAAVLTPMWEPMFGEGPGRAQREADFVRDILLHRFGTADEVAAMVLYLASDESAYVTGAEFTIDGGLLAGSTASPG
jgi:3(or 17)beta-hydroxysteroid dehydrogenase